MAAKSSKFLYTLPSLYIHTHISSRSFSLLSILCIVYILREGYTAKKSQIGRGLLCSLFLDLCVAHTEYSIIAREGSSLPSFALILSLSRSLNECDITIIQRHRWIT